MERIILLLIILLLPTAAYGAIPTVPASYDFYDLTVAFRWFSVGLAVWLFTWGMSKVWHAFKDVLQG